MSAVVFTENNILRDLEIFLTTTTWCLMIITQQFCLNIKFLFSIFCNLVLNVVISQSCSVSRKFASLSIRVLTGDFLQHINCIRTVNVSCSVLKRASNPHNSTPHSKHKSSLLNFEPWMILFSAAPHTVYFVSDIYNLFV